MEAQSVYQNIQQLASCDDYESFLSSCSSEQLSSFSSALDAHAKEFANFLAAKKEQSQNEFINKVSAAFSEDPEMAKALSRIIKGDFDKSKVIALGVQIMLPMSNDDSSESKNEDVPPPLEDSSEEEYDEEEVGESQ